MTAADSLVFVDTGAWYALQDADDRCHQAALCFHSFIKTRSPLAGVASLPRRGQSRAHSRPPESRLPPSL